MLSSFTRNLFILPPVSYVADGKGLSNFMSEHQLRLHYAGHHKAYVNKLNKLAKKVGLLDTPVASVVYDAANATPGSALGRFPQRIDLLNTAAQHFNHKLYWACMTRHPESMPAGLETRLEEEFGSIDEFKAEWERIALAHFGSGWIWLVEHEGELKIITTNNGETPVSTVDMFPCMCMDLWEHAWYADYENRKSEYVKGWWSVVDWDVIWDNVMAAQASASCTVCS